MGFNVEEDVKAWALLTGDFIYKKEIKVAERNENKIPYTAVNGVYDDKSDEITWWTNGFFAGELWMLYKAFGHEKFRKMQKT